MARDRERKSRGEVHDLARLQRIAERRRQRALRDEAEENARLLGESDTGEVKRVQASEGRAAERAPLLGERKRAPREQKRAQSPREESGTSASLESKTVDAFLILPPDKKLEVIAIFRELIKPNQAIEKEFVLRQVFSSERITRVSDKAVESLTSDDGLYPPEGSMSMDDSKLQKLQEHTEDSPFDANGDFQPWVAELFPEEVQHSVAQLLRQFYKLSIQSIRYGSEWRSQFKEYLGTDEKGKDLLSQVEDNFFGKNGFRDVFASVAGGGTGLPSLLESMQDKLGSNYVPFSSYVTQINRLHLITINNARHALDDLRELRDQKDIDQKVLKLVEDVYSFADNNLTALLESENFHQIPQLTKVLRSAIECISALNELKKLNSKKYEEYQKVFNEAYISGVDSTINDLTQQIKRQIKRESLPFRGIIIPTQDERKRNKNKKDFKEAVDHPSSHLSNLSRPLNEANGGDELQHLFRTPNIYPDLDFSRDRTPELKRMLSRHGQITEVKGDIPEDRLFNVNGEIDQKYSDDFIRESPLDSDDRLKPWLSQFFPPATLDALNRCLKQSIELAASATCDADGHLLPQNEQVFVKDDYQRALQTLPGGEKTLRDFLITAGIQVAGATFTNGEFPEYSGFVGVIFTAMGNNISALRRDLNKLNESKSQEASAIVTSCEERLTKVLTESKNFDYLPTLRSLVLSAIDADEKKDDAKLKQISIIIQSDGALNCKVALDKLRAKTIYSSSLKDLYDSFASQFESMCDNKDFRTAHQLTKSILQVNQQAESLVNFAIRREELNNAIETYWAQEGYLKENEYNSLKEEYDRFGKSFDALCQSSPINFNEICALECRVALKRLEASTIYGGVQKIFDEYNETYANLYQIKNFEELSRLSYSISKAAIAIETALITHENHEAIIENEYRNATIACCRQALALLDSEIREHPKSAIHQDANFLVYKKTLTQLDTLIAKNEFDDIPKLTRVVSATSTFLKDATQPNLDKYNEAVKAVPGKWKKYLANLIKFGAIAALTLSAAALVATCLATSGIAIPILGALAFGYLYTSTIALGASVATAIGVRLSESYDKSAPGHYSFFGNKAVTTVAAPRLQTPSPPESPTVVSSSDSRSLSDRRDSSIGSPPVSPTNSPRKP